MGAIVGFQSKNVLDYFLRPEPFSSGWAFLFYVVVSTIGMLFVGKLGEPKKEVGEDG